MIRNRIVATIPAAAGGQEHQATKGHDAGKMCHGQSLLQVKGSVVGMLGQYLAGRGFGPASRWGGLRG